MLKLKIDNMLKLNSEERADVLRANSKYKMLHGKLDEVENHLVKLKVHQDVIASLMETARDEEKELINKLEEKYNTKIDSAMLMEILGIEMYNI